jgi:hypothetical protein
VPFLRLIHCVVDDSIKDGYRNRDMVQPGRMEIENRNSSVREENVWEKIATLWNDEEFEPHTLILPDLHPYEFQTSEQLAFDKVRRLSPATPSKVKDKLSLMTRALRRCIDNWERSGQGEGGFDPFDGDDNIRPEFGTTRAPDPGTGRQERTAFALGSRYSFFKDREIYLLYFWELLEDNQLFTSCMAILPDDVAAQDGASSVPSVISNAAEKRSTTPISSQSAEMLTKLFIAAGSAFSEEDKKNRQEERELRMEERELKRIEIEDGRKKVEDWKAARFEEKTHRQKEFEMKKIELDAKNRELQDRIVGRKEKRLNEVNDYIKKQRMEIWKARNQRNECEYADFMEEELKMSEQEAKVLEVQIQQVQTMADSETGTPIRRNRNSTL